MCALFLGGLLLLSIATSVQAAAAGIRCDVFLGHDDVLTEGCWCPVTFEVQNDNPTFTATIVITSSYSRDDQSRSVTVELPTGTIKRFTIPVFVSSRFDTTWNVQLLDEQGNVRFEQGGLRPRRGKLANTTPLLGALPRTAAGLPALPKRSQQSELIAATARLQANLFPDNPLLLEAFTGLYLNSEITTGLKPAQVNALLGWLHSGGQLIIGLEQPGDLAATPWLRAIAPFEPKDLQTIPLNGQFRDWVNLAQARVRAPGNLDVGQLRQSARSVRTDLVPLPEDAAFDRGSLLTITGTAQGEVLLRAGEMPLVIEKAVGRGRVTLLCFSPEREPFKSWRSAPEFWAALLRLEIPPTNQQVNNYTSYSTDSIWGVLVDSKQVHKLPVAWLLVILLGYLAVIGPLDQYVLKRLNRQMLTWITFPLYVLAFSLLIYFIGYKLRAGESEWNEINVVDVLPAGAKSELRGRTYASIYSPANQRYELASKLRFATLRNEYLGPMNQGGDSESLVIQQNADAFKARATVSVWTSRLFVSDWAQPGETPLQATVTRSGTSLTFAMTNRLAKPLHAVHVLYAGRLHRLGEVPANQHATFTIQPSGGTPLTECANRWAPNFRQACDQRGRAFSSNRDFLSDRMDAAIGACLIGALSRGIPGGQFFTDPGTTDLPGLAERGHAVIFAMANDFSPVESLNQFKPLRHNRDTLLRLAVPVSQ